MKQFEFIPLADVEKMHEASMRMLERIGISTHSVSFKKLLLQNGCYERNGRIMMPQQIVEEYLKKAPAEVLIYRRDDGPPLELGQRKAYVQMGSGTPHILDPETGIRREYKLEDLKMMVRLGNELPAIDIVSCGVPTDVTEEIYTVTEIATMIKNSVKPAHLPVESVRELPAIFELLALVAGSMEKFQEKPFLFLEVSPISPLDFGVLPGEMIIGLAEKQIPIGIIPCNMMGATGPMTMAGAVAQQNAEVVAGIVAAQMVCPGLPVIMAPRVTFMDMVTGTGLWAAPEFGLAAICSISLAYFYDLPVSVSGFTTSAKSPDQQSGYERCFNTLCANLAGADIIGAAGSLNNVLISSPSQLVLDNEIASLACQIKRNIKVDPDTLAVDVLENVIKEQSSFLEQKHTRNHLRKGELWVPQISDRTTYAKWMENAENIEQKAARVAAEVASQWEPFLEPAFEREIDQIVAAAANKSF